MLRTSVDPCAGKRGPRMGICCSIPVWMRLQNAQEPEVIGKGSAALPAVFLAGCISERTAHKGEGNHALAKDYAVVRSCERDLNCSLDPFQ